MDWPTAPDDDTFAPIPGREDHRLDLYLVEGEVADLQLDGESVWPVWFKIEWKGTGDVSAKIRGLKLSTRQGDAIAIHHGPPPTGAPVATAGRARCE